jgi:hypothetical protein
MSGHPESDQSGGVNIHGGTVNTAGGDIVGHDKVVHQGTSSEQLEAALRPLTEAISTASPEKRAEAKGTLEELKSELENKEKSDDSRVAKLVEGLLNLVPGAAGAVANAFGTPILGAIAGPVTKYVLNKIGDT